MSPDVAPMPSRSRDHRQRSTATIQIIYSHETSVFKCHEQHSTTQKNQGTDKRLATTGYIRYSTGNRACCLQESKKKVDCLNRIHQGSLMNAFLCKVNSSIKYIGLYTCQSYRSFQYHLDILLSPRRLPHHQPHTRKQTKQIVSILFSRSTEENEELVLNV